MTRKQTDPVPGEEYWLQEDDSITRSSDWSAWNDQIRAAQKELGIQKRYADILARSQEAPGSGHPQHRREMIAHRCRSSGQRSKKV